MSASIELGPGVPDYVERTRPAPKAPLGPGRTEFDYYRTRVIFATENWAVRCIVMSPPLIRDFGDGDGSDQCYRWQRRLHELRDVVLTSYDLERFNAAVAELPQLDDFLSRHVDGWRL